MTQATTNSYFNLTAEGIGFLNRPRRVTGKKIDYFACTIQASRGNEGDKTRFDLRVVGGQAKELFEQLLEQFPDLENNDFKKRPKVVVGFRAGDIQATVFESTNARTKEKVVTPSIDGRLLKFNFIKVNGEFWYKSSAESSIATAESSIAIAEEELANS